MLNNERDFKGVWIPKEIWLDERLNALDKCIFIEVDSLDSEEKGCYASNKYLADFCQCSETKVSTAISKLIKLGYLYLKSFDGRQRILKSRFTKNAEQTFKNCKAELQNLKEINNKDNNKINNISNIKESKKALTNYEAIINDNIQDEEIKQSIYEFIKMRTIIKKPLTDRALQMIISKLNKLSNGDSDTAVEILNQSIINNWQDIYALKEQQHKQSGHKEDMFEQLDRVFREVENERIN